MPDLPKGSQRRASTQVLTVRLRVGRSGIPRKRKKSLIWELRGDVRTGMRLREQGGSIISKRGVGGGKMRHKSTT